MFCRNYPSGSKEDDFLISSMYFCYIVIISPWKRAGCPILNKLESPLPKDALCEVWLKLAQWFCRRRWKCEKFTDSRRQTPGDQKSSIGCSTDGGLLDRELKCTYCHLQSCTRKTLPCAQPHYTTLSWEQGSKNFQTLNCQPPSVSGSQRNTNKVGLYQGCVQDRSG